MRNNAASPLASVRTTSSSNKVSRPGSASGTRWTVLTTCALDVLAESRAEVAVGASRHHVGFPVQTNLGDEQPSHATGLLDRVAHGGLERRALHDPQVRRHRDDHGRALCPRVACRAHRREGFEAPCRMAGEHFHGVGPAGGECGLVGAAPSA